MIIMATASFSNSTLSISGAVTFESVTALERQIKKLIVNQESDIIVDLNEVEQSNSAALGLMLEIKRLLRGREVKFINLPIQLQSMVSVYGISSVLKA